MSNPSPVGQPLGAAIPLNLPSTLALGLSVIVVQNMQAAALTNIPEPHLPIFGT